MPLQDDYHVSLSHFKGPLDLLLFLIRRAEVDIADIPIRQITEQYLAFLQQIDEIDIDMAGDFLVMAATLIEIKSRSIQPAHAKTGMDDEHTGPDLSDADPRYELVQQLLAYQKYRLAAEELDRLREISSNRFPARPGSTRPEDTDAEPVEIELDDAHILDLFEAYERIAASINFDRLGDHRVEYDDTPIALHQEDLLDRLGRADAGRITLQQAFTGRSRGEVIGLFLATLELVRQRRVLVRQDDLLGEIVLELNADPEEANLPAPPHPEPPGDHHPPAAAPDDPT